jgi:hypothetical protein
LTKAFGIETASDFGAPQHDATTAQQARSNCAVKCFGRGGESHPRCDDTGHQAMLGNRAQHRVGQEFLLGARHRTGHEQPEVTGEINLADDFTGQVVAAHRDAGRIRFADRG